MCVARYACTVCKYDDVRAFDGQKATVRSPVTMVTGAVRPAGFIMSYCIKAMAWRVRARVCVCAKGRRTFVARMKENRRTRKGAERERRAEK